MSSDASFAARLDFTVQGVLYYGSTGNSLWRIATSIVLQVAPAGIASVPQLVQGRASIIAASIAFPGRHRRKHGVSTKDLVWLLDEKPLRDRT